MKTVIETIARHLAEQQAQAIDASGNCQYHTEDGKSCAVGALFEPDERRDLPEDTNVSGLMDEDSGSHIRRMAEEEGVDPEDFVVFLSKVQSYHDLDRTRPLPPRVSSTYLDALEEFPEGGEPLYQRIHADLTAIAEKVGL